MHLFPNKHLLSTKNVIRTKCDLKKRQPLLATYCWAFGWNRKHQGNKFSTISLKLTSVRWYHQRYISIEIPWSPQLRILLKGIQRLSDPVLKKQPVIPAFLRLLRRRLDFMRPLQRLIWGSIVLGFFFLLRRSEYIKIGAKQHDYCLRTTDVFFSDERLSCQLQSSVISDHRTVWSEERPVWSMGVAHDAPLERSPHLPGESIASYPESPARVERGIMCALVC